VPESPLQTAIDDADEKNDEEHDGTYAPYSDFQLFRDWFKSLSHWPRALISLDTDGNIVKFIATQNLNIRSISVPSPLKAARQASLEATLKSFCKDAEEVEAARDWIREAAKRRGHAPLLARFLAGSKDEGWTEMFTGAVHCECALACMVKGQPHLRKLGVSKRCCFACLKFLEKMQAFEVPPTHGKVYPWTPPIETPMEVKKHVLDELKSVLQDAIESGRKRRDSHAGSDADHTEGGELRTVRKAKAKAEDLPADFAKLLQD